MLTGRTSFSVVTTLVVSGLVFLGIVLFGEAVEPVNESDANSYSRSAIGHGALVTLLEELGIPVVRSRFQTKDRVSADSLLLLLEPDLVDAPRDRKRLLEMCTSDAAFLLVLPKWRGVADPERDGWLRSAELLPEDETLEALDALDVEAELVRPESVGDWQVGQMPYTPTLDRPQLLRTGGVEPLVASDDLVLFGRLDDHANGYVLTDPDLLSNHGLARRENGLLVLQLLNLAGRGVLVIDETLHGFEVPPSFWMNLARFPNFLIPLTLVLVVLLAILTAAPRFGTPHTAVAAVERSKRLLIENTTDLLSLGSDPRAALARTFDLAVTEVATALRVRSKDLGREALLERLDHLRAVRMGQPASESARELGEAVARLGRGHLRNTAQVLACARRIHQWKRGMQHGREFDS